MKRSFLFLLLYCFFVFQAAAQKEAYTITQAELTRLEEISVNLETSRLKLQSQAQSLKRRLTEALKKSESLNAQLKAERETLKSLRSSYEKYGKEMTQLMQEKDNEIKHLTAEKQRLKQSLTVAVCALIVLSLGGIGFFVFKTKLKFLGG